MEQLPWMQYEMLWRRASYKLYVRYRINKEELRMLGRLAWYLAHLNRVIISREALCDVLTGNSREKPKLFGYVEGLIAGGFVGSYYYTDRVDSVSLGISVKGARVLKEFGEELRALATRYGEHVDTDTVKLMGGLSETPKYYTLRVLAA